MYFDPKLNGIMKILIKKNAKNLMFTAPARVHRSEMLVRVDSLCNGLPFSLYFHVGLSTYVCGSFSKFSDFPNLLIIF